MWQVLLLLLLLLGLVSARPTVRPMLLPLPLLLLLLPHVPLADAGEEVVVAAVGTRSVSLAQAPVLPAAVTPSSVCSSSAAVPPPPAVAPVHVLSVRLAVWGVTGKVANRSRGWVEGVERAALPSLGVLGAGTVLAHCTSPQNTSCLSMVMAPAKVPPLLGPLVALGER